MPRNCAKTSWPVAAWLILCAFLNCDGWLLSALHELNATGYIASFAAGAAVLVFALRRAGAGAVPRVNFHRLRRRFTRAFPAAFLVLAVLVFLGGAIHAPANYDGLAYREPRVLNWIADGRWHWIHTLFHRLNVRACGFEWLTAPMFVLLRTDRLVFLINYASFLLLPGLVFSVFTRLGIASRTAWHWMWLAPTGYCYLLQAGSIANDGFAAVFAMAALDFALRARMSGSAGQFYLSCIAAGLLTGTKSSNIPLLLPWAVAIAPAVRLAFRNLPATAAVAVVAAGASFLPVAVLNWKNCGDWSGQAAEQALFVKEYPVLHLAQNTALITLLNVVPPVFPMAGAWDRLVTNTMPHSLDERLLKIFEPGGAHLNLPEMQNEEMAGLGFGLTLLLVVTFLATRNAGNSATTGGGWSRRIILLGAWLAPLPLLAVSGATSPARYLAPEYFWMAPVFLYRQSGSWIGRHRWWKMAGMVVFLIAAVLVIISPARPLWPANYVLDRVNADGHPLLARARKVYAVYGNRADGFAPVRARLPEDASVLGMITFDDPETSLWRPFGTRRIVHVLPQDSPETLGTGKVEYVLVNLDVFKERFNMPFETWTALMRGQLLWQMPVTLRASRPPANWCLVRVPPPGPSAFASAAP
jgi:hypothetical protein